MPETLLLFKIALVAGLFSGIAAFAVNYRKTRYVLGSALLGAVAFAAIVTGLSVVIVVVHMLKIPD